MKHIHFLMSLAAWTTLSMCVAPQVAIAATAGYTGGRVSVPTPSWECLDQWNDKLADDAVKTQTGPGRYTVTGVSRCYEDRKTCNLNCWVYCYDPDGISLAQRIPCGGVTCEFWLPCMHHPKEINNVRACKNPAMNPCATVDVSTQPGCDGGRATLEQCKTQYLGYCATTSGAEVCCE